MELTVQTAKPYSVLIEHGLLSRTGEHCLSLFPAGTRVMVISDSNVFPLYGETVMDSLRRAGYEVYSPPGSRASSCLRWRLFTGRLGKTALPAAILS